MDTAWKQVSKDFNRFIQRFRRLHNVQVQYIRTIEAHNDSYPHLHAVLQLPASLTITNARYFDRELFKKWKQLWTSGLSDYRPPNPKQQSPVLYIVKYISKSSSSYRTVWKKLLRNVSPVASSSSTSNEKPKSVELANSQACEITSDSVKFATTLLFCKQHKLRPVTWSRGFIFPAIPKRGLGKPPQCLISAEFK